MMDLEPIITIKHYVDGKLVDCDLIISKTDIHIKGYPNFSISTDEKSNINLQIKEGHIPTGLLKIFNSTVSINDFMISGSENFAIVGSKVDIRMVRPISFLSITESEIKAKIFETNESWIYESKLLINEKIVLNGVVGGFHAVCNNLTLSVSTGDCCKGKIVLNENFDLEIIGDYQRFEIKNDKLLMLPPGNYCLQIGVDKLIQIDGRNHYPIMSNGDVFGLVTNYGTVIKVLPDDMIDYGTSDVSEEYRFLNIYIDRLRKNLPVDKKLIFFRTSENELQAVYPKYDQLNLVISSLNEWELYECKDITCSDFGATYLIHHLGKTMQIQMDKHSTITGVLNDFQKPTNLYVTGTRVWFNEGVTLSGKNTFKNSIVDINGGKLSDVTINNSTVRGRFIGDDVVISDSDLECERMVLTDTSIVNGVFSIYYALQIASSMVKNSHLIGLTGVIANCYVSYLKSVDSPDDFLILHRLHYGTFNSIIEYQYTLRSCDIDITLVDDFNKLFNKDLMYIDIEGYSFPLNEKVSEDKVKDLLEDTAERLGLECSFNAESLIHQIQSRIDVINLVSSN